MAPLKIPPKTLPAPAWWSVLSDLLGCSPRLGRAFWVAFAASHEPQVQALRYRCDQLEGHAILRPPLDQVAGGACPTEDTSMPHQEHLVRRAAIAYLRSEFADGRYHPALPATTEEVAYAGRRYVILRHGPDILAVYRIKNNGRLQRRHRWPQALEDVSQEGS